MDHIQALAAGGEHNNANVQLLCRRCNTIKGDRTMRGLMRALWQREDTDQPFEHWLLDRIFFDVADLMSGGRGFIS